MQYNANERVNLNAARSQLLQGALFSGGTITLQLDTAVNLFSSFTVELLGTVETA